MDNEHKVLMDIRDQAASIGQQVVGITLIKDKEAKNNDGLSLKQQQVLDELERESSDFDQEKKSLEKKKQELQKELLANQKDIDEKKFKNRKVECQIKQHQAKITSMDSYLHSLV